MSVTRAPAQPPATTRAAPAAPARPWRPWRWLPRGLAGRPLGLVPLATLGALAFSQLDALESMSLEELRELRPALRALAERRAGGEVRAPQVRQAPGAFRLVYRRGQGCKVVVTVDRSSPVLAPAEKGAVSVASTGCRRRAGT